MQLQILCDIVVNGKLNNCFLYLFTITFMVFFTFNLLISLLCSDQKHWSYCSNCFCPAGGGIFNLFKLWLSKPAIWVIIICITYVYINSTIDVIHSMEIQLHLYKSSVMNQLSMNISFTIHGITSKGTEQTKHGSSDLWHLDQKNWHKQISHITLSLYRDGSSGRCCAAGRASGLMEMGR